jgi:hypothetical protein
LLLYRAARDEVVAIRTELAWVAAVVVVCLAVVNVPWPGTAYLRGLLTGVVVVAVLWLVAWRVWVVSGLGARLNGVWSEDWAASELRQHRCSLRVVRGLALPGRDVDAVLVTTCAVYVVEVKWRQRRPYARTIAADCDSLAESQTFVRTQVADLGIPERLVRRLLVVCGPGGRSMGRRMMGTDLSRCRVLPARELESWLEEQTPGSIGPDIAEQVAERLAARADELDAARSLGLGWRLVARNR